MTLDPLRPDHQAALELARERDAHDVTRQQLARAASLLDASQRALAAEQAEHATTRANLTTALDEQARALHLLALVRSDHDSAPARLLKQHELDSNQIGQLAAENHRLRGELSHVSGELHGIRDERAARIASQAALAGQLQDVRTRLAETLDELRDVILEKDEMGRKSASPGVTAQHERLRAHLRRYNGELKELYDANYLLRMKLDETGQAHAFTEGRLAACRLLLGEIGATIWPDLASFDLDIWRDWQRRIRNELDESGGGA